MNMVDKLLARKCGLGFRLVNGVGVYGCTTFTLELSCLQIFSNIVLFILLVPNPFISPQKVQCVLTKFASLVLSKIWHQHCCVLRSLMLLVCIICVSCNGFLIISVSDLQGETGKMSASDPNSAIYVTDSAKDIKNKVSVSLL